jgi:hypothetical protein
MCINSKRAGNFFLLAYEFDENELFLVSIGQHRFEKIYRECQRVMIWNPEWAFMFSDRSLGDWGAQHDYFSHPLYIPFFCNLRNRVGGGLTAPTSHTTVRAVRHTAVHVRFCKRRCSSRRLKSPCRASHVTEIAKFIWDAPAFHHGPLPL